MNNVYAKEDFFVYLTLFEGVTGSKSISNANYQVDISIYFDENISTKMSSLGSLSSNF